MRISPRVMYGLMTVGAAVLLGGGSTLLAQDKFARTDARNQYVHRIHLYDAAKKLIDPADPNAPPYSPMATCGKCHDYKSISHGWHFNAMDATIPAGRPGEPWLWVDRRTGTQAPLSYRGWPGTFKPGDVGMTPWRFALTFGRHLPGGIEAPTTDASPDARWKLAGDLAIDCMICHGDNRSFDHEVWARQIAQQNFAWASTAAAGLGHVEGSVARLPKDFDASAAPVEGKPGVPKVAYQPHLFDAEKKAFFDVVRQPPNNNCYYCHTSRPVGPAALIDWNGPAALVEWNQDLDVHMKAGLNCASCHRNGIEHDTVRGFVGEKPHGDLVGVASLSCVGCHVGTHDPASLSEAGGRLGAPEPQHYGIPPLHFKTLSCTVCHSGPLPQMTAGRMQTSMAHELGLPSQTRADDDQPIIVAPVYLRNREGVIEPHRMVWPAYWGRIQPDDGDRVTPIDPEAAYAVLRPVLRIRSDFQRELGNVRLAPADKVKLLGDERGKLPESQLTQEEKLKLAQATAEKAAGEFGEKVAKALETLAKDQAAGAPVYISAGKLYRLGERGKLETINDHPAAKPYTWPIAHDVRPARQALGVGGCADCHAANSPFIDGRVLAGGPAPDATPIATTMGQLQGHDETLWQAWNASFAGRDAFKVLAIVVLSLLTLIVLMFAARAVGGLSAWLNRPRRKRTQ